MKCVFDNFAEGHKKQQDSLADYLAKCIRDSFNVTHRFNAVYCFSMLSFNETTLQKLVDVAEDLRSRMLEDQDFSTYFKDKVIQKIENLVSVKDEVKQLVDELQIKLNGSEVELMKVRSTSKNQQSKGKGSTKGSKRKDSMMSDSEASQNEDSIMS